jgi:hypothetical protein
MKGEMMPDQLSGSDRLPAGNLARVIGVIALAAVVIIHGIDRPGTLRAIPLIGCGCVVLIAAALVVASPLVTVPEHRVDAGQPDGIRGHLAHVLRRTSGLPSEGSLLGTGTVPWLSRRCPRRP